jgi:hypothetical protein
LQVQLQVRKMHSPACGRVEDSCVRKQCGLDAKGSRELNIGTGKWISFKKKLHLSRDLMDGGHCGQGKELSGNEGEVSGSDLKAWRGAFSSRRGREELQTLIFVFHVNHQCQWAILSEI